MPDESPRQEIDCAFCDRWATKDTLLYEGENFYAIADFAPVSEAHILLIPHHHYPHLGALPPSLDEEFHTMKGRIGRFVQEQYGRLAYWENGVFGQSVPHAHLHSIALELDTSVYETHGVACQSLADLRSHHSRGESHYFFVEHTGVGRVLPPDPELYSRVIRHARERNGGIWRYNPMERRMHGRPIVAEMIQRWRTHFEPPPSVK